MAQATQAGLIQRPGVRQFVKFCIVGLSSAVIDISISSTLIFHFSANPTWAKIVSFLFAVTNGFIWNSRWTFKSMGSGRRHELYVKFLLVNCVGLFLNVLIFTVILFLLTGQFLAPGKPERLHFILATVIAIGCVSAWNFLANKKWTFKHSPSTHSDIMREQQTEQM